MPILDLRLTNAGPFDKVEFEFDEQINVLVGPNNCGKSTALMALGAILLPRFRFPTKLLRTSQQKWTLGYVPAGATSTEVVKGSLGPGQATQVSAHCFVFQDGHPSVWDKVGYACYIPPLRCNTDFRSQGPTSGERHVPRVESGSPVSKASTTRKPLRANGRDGEGGASLIRDEDVIQKIVELDYRAYREAKPSIRRVIGQIAMLASEITEDFPIEFVGVGEDAEGLYPEFRTPDGNVPLNVLSQGTQSIIQWLARTVIGYAEHYDFPEDPREKPGVLVIDEIDAHLHPSWQRRILPALTEAFPKLQIFCSTHSPLMLAGLKAGQVQLLRRDKKGKVVVSRNETDVVGWSADEILRNFLDVPNPTDMQTDDRLNRLQELRRKKKLSAKEKRELESLREGISGDLLGGPIATQLDELAQFLEDRKAGKPKGDGAKAARTTKKTSAPRKKRSAGGTRRGSN